MRLVGEYQGVERRKFKRWVFPENSARVRIRCVGQERFEVHGWVKDVSRGGARVELDEPLVQCMKVELMITFGAKPYGPICALGNLIRFNDPDQDGNDISIAFTRIAKPHSDQEFDRLLKEIVLDLYDPLGIA